MTATRGCASCGRRFPIPANNPHRRYCTPRCRVADWRQRHQPAVEGHHDTTSDDVTNAVPPPDAANAAPHCPHCGRPVAVVTLLLPPTAAHIRIPQAPHA
jgi:endogenous inhibitor of DNA gyrase (YacG/DUF329 family)